VAASRLLAIIGGQAIECQAKNPQPGWRDRLKPKERNMMPLKHAPKPTAAPGGEKNQEPFHGPARRSPRICHGRSPRSAETSKITGESGSGS
jgi:hypothetical protein